MNKGELIKDISKEANIHKTDADKAINSITSNIMAALKRGDRFTIKDFGSFYTVKKAERIGRNPQTGEPVKIIASKTVKFKLGKEFSEKFR